MKQKDHGSPIFEFGQLNRLGFEFLKFSKRELTNLTSINFIRIISKTLMSNGKE